MTLCKPQQACSRKAGSVEHCSTTWLSVTGMGTMEYVKPHLTSTLMEVKFDSHHLQIQDGHLTRIQNCLNWGQCIGGRRHSSSRYCCGRGCWLVKSAAFDWTTIVIMTTMMIIIICYRSNHFEPHFGTSPQGGETSEHRKTKLSRHPPSSFSDRPPD